jgi:F0F1-type ATP synthase assembly protein I
VAAETDPLPFILLLILGLIVGTAGHVYKSKTAIATGVALVFLGTVLLPAIVYYG